MCNNIFHLIFTCTCTCSTSGISWTSGFAHALVLYVKTFYIGRHVIGTRYGRVCKQQAMLLRTGQVYIDADTGESSSSTTSRIALRTMDALQGFKVMGTQKVEKALPVGTALTAIGEVVSTQPVQSFTPPQVPELSGFCLRDCNAVLSVRHTLIWWSKQYMVV